MFILDRSGRRPLHIKLYDHIKNQISSGKLPPNTRLPSVRNLSADLAISRNTVECAYDQLRTEGFIYSKPQSGYYVSLLEQEFTPYPLLDSVAPLERVFETEKKYLFDFHPACLSPDSFPSKVWRKLMTQCLLEQAEQSTRYGNPQGEFALRSEIQQYLERFRGVSCSPEQIVICCGFQDSLSIVAQIMRSKHSVLAVEEPGHWIPKLVFEKYSFSVRPIPVYEDGIDVEYLKSTDSSIVYVTPSHQFPLGHVMPMEKRLELIKWAESSHGVIIEDDYDSELRYHGKPIPALQGLYPQGNIIYLGTFSKVLSPALRVSYLVLPQQYLGVYNKLFNQYAASVSYFEQRTLFEFMRQGYWERHLRKMRTTYKRKHDALIHSIQRYFGDRVNLLGQGAGLHITLEFADPLLGEKELIRRAYKEQIRLFPISETYQCSHSSSTKIMLGFGRMNPDELEQGIKILARVWNLQ